MAAKAWMIFEELGSGVECFLLLYWWMLSTDFEGLLFCIARSAWVVGGDNPRLFVEVSGVVACNIRSSMLYQMLSLSDCSRLVFIVIGVYSMWTISSTSREAYIPRSRHNHEFFWLR